MHLKLKEQTENVREELPREVFGHKQKEVKERG
jgi:hypothetical protein